MKKKIIQIGVISSSMLLLVLSLLTLNSNTQKVEEDQKDIVLNVALVNEDTGVKDEGSSEKILLGNNYIKQIENDKANNWYVVSRGIAESGLKNGKYQLMIIIPTNFSEKVFDLNNPSPEKLSINYKVNSNGNSSIENEANTLGTKLINGLNKQLVDVYVASIVSNLYVAQKNIEKVYAGEQQSIGSYGTNVHDSALAFQERFPELLVQSNSGVESNTSMSDTLSKFTESFTPLLTSYDSTIASFQELIDFREKGKITYQEFVTALMAMDADILSEETVAKYTDLQVRNSYLQTQLNDRDTEGTFANYMKQLDEQYQLSKETFTKYLAETNADSEEKTEKYMQQLYKKIYGENGKPDGVELTVGDIIKKENQSLYEDLEASINLNDATSIQAKINALPWLKTITAEENPEIYSLLSLQKNQTIVNQINERIATLQEEGSRINSLGLVHLDLETTDWWAANNFKATAKTYKEEQEKVGVSQTITLSNLSQFRKGKLVVTVPAGVTITTPNNGTENEFTITKNEMVLTYTYTNEDGTYPKEKLGNLAQENLTIQITSEETAETDTPTEPDVSVETSATKNAVKAKDDATAETEETTDSTSKTTAENQPKIATVTTNNGSIGLMVTIPIDFSVLATDSYTTAAEDYSTEIGSLLEKYRAIATEIENYESSAEYQLNRLLHTSVEEYYRNLLDDVYTGTNGERLDLIQTVEKEYQAILAKKEQLSLQFTEVQNGTATLQSSVDTQMDLLTSWKSQMGEITSNETGVSSMNEGTNTQIEANFSLLKSLLETSKTLKESSETNVEANNRVKEVFTSFDQSVKAAQEKGNELSASANTVMDQFNKELQENGDFVGSFTKVLSNAYNQGVSNDTLLKFISNPLQENLAETIQSAEVYTPFTWVLLFFGISLFTGYLFSTHKFVSKTRDIFKQNVAWLTDNMVNTILIVGSMLIVGIFVGSVSASSLYLVAVMKFSWVMYTVLLLMIFALLNNFLIEKLDVYGLASSLVLFISYIFVSDAVGNSVITGKFAQLIMDKNPLLATEHLLSQFLSSQVISGVSFVYLALILLGCILLNIFIPNINKNLFRGWHSEKDTHISH